jgi:hypothetical protein
LLLPLLAESKMYDVAKNHSILYAIVEFLSRHIALSSNGTCHACVTIDHDMASNGPPTVRRLLQLALKQY